jgi:protein-S-isoprenylcysteine O-methyltransferase Ste14
MSQDMAIYAPWIILLAVGLYGFVHSLLASLEVKAFVRNWLGEKGSRGYRLFYNFFAILSFLPLLVLVGALPDQVLYTIPLPWTLITLALQGLAILVLILGVIQVDAWQFLGIRQFAADREVENDTLVVTGLYRWVRHPLYTAGLIFIWCAPVMSLNLLALNLGLTLYILGGAWYEERKLVRVFGERYLSYARSTPMLIPGLLFLSGRRPGGQKNPD